MSQRQIRVYLDGSLVLPLGVCPLTGVGLQICECVVTVCQAVVQADCLLSRCLGFWNILFWIQNAARSQASVDIGEFGVGQSVFRIYCDCLVEILGCLLPILSGSARTIGIALQQQFVSVWVNDVALGDVLLLTRGEPQPKLICYLARDVSLNLKKVSRLPVILLAPNLSPVASIYQLGADQQ